MGQKSSVLQIQRIVVEEQHNGQEDAKHISVTVAPETEHKVQQHNKRKHNRYPNQMEGRGGFRDIDRISNKGLRYVCRYHHNQNAGEGDKETYPFPFVKDIEAVLASDLKDQRDGKSHD